MLKTKIPTAEMFSNKITIEELYKKINNLFQENINIFSGFTIVNVSINKKLEKAKNGFYYTFYDGVVQTQEKNTSNKKKEFANIQIPNQVLDNFFTESDRESLSETKVGIKIDVVIDRIYLTKRGVLNIVAASIKETGVSDRELKIRKLKKYINTQYKNRDKRMIPNLVTSIFAISSSSSNINEDIENIAIISDIVIRKAKNPNEIKNYILDEEAQSKDIIVLFRGGHEDENMEMFSTVEVIDAIALSNKPVVTALGHKEDSPFIEKFADKAFATPSEFAKSIASLVLLAIEDKKAVVKHIAKHLSVITSSEQMRNKDAIKKIDRIYEYCLKNANRETNNQARRVETQCRSIFSNLEYNLTLKRTKLTSLVDSLINEETSNIQALYNSIEHCYSGIVSLEKEKRENLERLQEQKRKNKNIIVVVIAVSILLMLALFLLMK